MVLLQKKSGNVKMVALKTQEGLFAVAKEVSSDTPNKAADIRQRLWHERLGHYG